MNVLVTGGAGYIGSHTVAHLRRLGHQVVVLDDLSGGHAEAIAGVPLIVGDVRSPAALARALRESDADAVVHFAGLIDAAESVRQPDRYFEVNAVGTLQVLRAMRRSRARVLIHSSTAAVYGARGSEPLREIDETAPVNPYGRSKLAAEGLLADHARAAGIACVSLRYFNAAGAGLEHDLGEDHACETHLVPLTLQVALGQRPYVDLRGGNYDTRDGTCIRDFVHVDDLARAHCLALEAAAPGAHLVCNLGSETGFTVREVIEACRRVTGARIPVRPQPRRPGDPPCLVASCERARRELAWVPRHRALDDIVASAWSFHRRHPHGYGATIRVPGPGSPTTEVS